MNPAGYDHSIIKHLDRRIRILTAWQPLSLLYYIYTAQGYMPLLQDIDPLGIDNVEKPQCSILRLHLSLLPLLDR